MKYLLDTHIVLWFFENDKRLSEQTKEIILSPVNDLYVSMSSLWEMHIKKSSGKLFLDYDIFEYLQKII